MNGIDGETLRKWRRARGWDIAAVARELRVAAGDDPVAAHDALVRMVRRWERSELRTERYELLYAKTFGITPEQLRAGSQTDRPKKNESQSGRPADRHHASGVIAALAAALHAAPRDEPPRDRPGLERDLRLAWELRQSARYAELGTLTAALLLDTAENGVDPDLRSHACNIGVSLAKSLGAHEMSAMLADRAFTAATATGDELMVGAAKMRVANVYLAAGHHAQSVTVAAAAADTLPPGRRTTPAEAATFGTLLLCAAVAAAKQGETGQAWEFFGHAKAGLPVCGGTEHADLYGVFGPGNMAVHAVQIATELGDGREALRRAELADPNRLPDVLLERRATLAIDIARAHEMQGHVSDAGAVLLAAERIAPLEIAYSPAARNLLASLLARPRVSGDIRALATRLNVAA